MGRGCAFEYESGLLTCPLVCMVSPTEKGRWVSFHGGMVGGDGNVAASEDMVDPGSDKRT